MRAFVVIFTAFYVILTILFEPFLNYYEAKYMREFAFRPSQILSFSQNLTSYINGFLCPNLTQTVSKIEQSQKPVSSFKPQDEMLLALSKIEQPRINKSDFLKTNEKVAQKATDEDKNETKFHQKVADMANKTVEQKSQKPKTHSDTVVFLIGDSIAQGIGWGMQKRFGDRLNNIAKVSTGLVNKKFFNWQNELENALANTKNTGKMLFVVALFGANDAYGFGKFKFDTKAWDDEYLSRINELYKISAKYGAKLVWLGVPCMKNNELNSKMVKLNFIFKKASAQNNSLFVDLAEPLCDNGSFIKHKTTNNKNQTIRANDGIHLSPQGAKIATDYILEKMNM
ncbi:MAG: DUF459 domain-containing protein [Campylobacter sp.]